MSGPNARVERWCALPAARRRIAGGAVLVMGLLLAALVVTTRGEKEEKSRGQARPGSTEGMAGMEGMDIPASGGSVRLTATQIREFGVTFGTAEQRTLTDEVRTVGTVAFDETRVAQVASKFDGVAERLYVGFTGQPVRRGQPLLEIYSPEVVAAQEELLLAARLQRTVGESSVPGAGGRSPDLVAAAERRLRLWDVSPAQIEQLRRTGRVRRTVTLFAPVSGVVVEKPVVLGQALEAGQTLYTIADLSQVWVEAELREADAGAVREGARATVEMAAFPGRPIAGTVEYVYPTLQSEARSLKARIVVPNPGGRLKPGMYATVRLSAPVRAALTVPSSAVVRTGERSLVFVDLGGGSLAPQEVETGRTAGEQTEITSGVEPGQRVVTSAQFLLDSESNLAATMRGMIGMGGSGAMGGMEGMDMKGADMKGMNIPPERR